MSQLSNVLLGGTRNDVVAIITRFMVVNRPGSSNFTLIPNPLIYIPSDMIFLGNSTSVAGLWNLNLLYYQPKKITVCDSISTDVISAGFNGCLMAKFSVAGQHFVAHVGTSDLKSDDRKYEWFKFLFVNQKNVNLECIFRPGYNLILNVHDKCCGVITSDNECYSILYQVRNGVNNIRNIRIIRHFFQCSDLQSFLSKMLEVSICCNELVDPDEWNKIWNYYNNHDHTYLCRIIP
jgi:hypothetical protein